MLGWLAVLASLAAPSGLVPPPPVLDCTQRVEGPPHWPPPGWRRDAVTIGPVSFVGLRSAANRAPDGFPGVETTAMVRAGKQVTIRVQGASLVWPGAEHKHAVTLRACASGTRRWSRPGRVGRYTQFNGGFRLTSPECVPIDVWIDRRKHPLRRRLELGRSCPTRPRREGTPSDIATGLIPPPLVLGCGDRVETARGFPPPNWRRRSVSAGPITLYNLRDNARVGAAETVALVRANRQVTLSIPPPNRRDLTLLFGPATKATTFKACPRTTRRFSGHHGPVGRFTLFQGGVGARGRRCAPLDFWIHPRSHPRRRYVGFGRRC